MKKLMIITVLLLLVIFIDFKYRKNWLEKEKTEKVVKYGSLSNRIEDDNLMDFYVYLSKNSSKPKITETTELIWSMKKVKYGSEDVLTHSLNSTIPLVS